MSPLVFSRLPASGVLLASLFTAACVLSSEFAAAETPTPLPNVVVILADDLGQGDLGCYNDESKVPTPHYDRLAKEGLRLTDAHSPSSVCTPTRYGLLTGRYCWRSSLKRGVLYGYSPMLIQEDRMTLGSLMQQKGYTTGVVGKWHLGLGSAKKTDYHSGKITPSPNDRGFDYSYIIPASLDMAPYVWVEDGTPVEKPTEQSPGSKRVWDGGEGFWRAGPIAPSFTFEGVLPTIAEKSVAFIDRAAKNETPFLLYVPFASPHTPWVPTDEFDGKSEAGTYGDFVHQTDHCVGQILAALDKHGLTENTLVIATSDNGSHWRPQDIEEFDHAANNGYRGMKADIWEAGHRVPFLVRWPAKVRAGSTYSEPVCLTDIFATVADVSGQEIPADQGEDSVSLLPLLTGEGLGRPIRQTVIHHSAAGVFAIRAGRYKLVDNELGSGGFTQPRRQPPKKDGPQGQLYDLYHDRTESTNVWTENPERVDLLQQALGRVKAEGGLEANSDDDEIPEE